MKEAQAVVKEMAISGRMKRSEPAASCTEVNNTAIELTTLVMKSPASPQILVFSDTIIASRNIPCTEAEKVSLSELDPMFEEAVAEIKSAKDALCITTGCIIVARLETAIRSFQQQLEILTGALGVV